jgi:tetratricopeptide (TPR) repeat protein
VRTGFLLRLPPWHGMIMGMHGGKFCGRLLLTILASASVVFGQMSVPPSVYQRVDADLQQGRLLPAEAALRRALENYPNDAHALGMLGVVLDAEKKYKDAEVYYAEALRLDPQSASLWNNFGNHYLTIRDIARAHRAYLRVISLDPHHPNANLQLATMSVEAKRGRQALHYLTELPRAADDQAAVKLLRAEALHLSGEGAEAERLLGQLESEDGSDARVPYSVGMVEVEWKQYKRAEQSLKRALVADPANPDVTYNLGLCALNAGDVQTAQPMLAAALRQRPNDVDALYNLARLENKLGDNDQAVVHLVRAHQLAPRRSDVLVLMGYVSEDLGYYGDAAQAFQDDLKLDPANDLVRRAYGFALAHTPQIDQAVAVLGAYVTRHPKDARGLYDLGVSETVRNQPAAIRDLRRSISLDPNMTAASYAMAAVLDQQAHYHAALKILEPLAQHSPENYRVLELLGQVELQLDQPEQAVEALRRAAILAPRNRRVLIQYSQALEHAHHSTEALAVLKRYQDLPPEAPRPYRGLLYYLSMPGATQRSQYLARLQQDVDLNPLDTDLELRWAAALLEEGKTQQSLQAFDRLLAERPGPTILKEAVTALLARGQYLEARKFLVQAVTADPSSLANVLDLSIAIFHTAGSTAALEELDKTPIAARQGDYYLLRAQILDVMGKAREAATDLTLGLRSSPTRPDLYYEAALFLMQHGQARELFSLLQSAVQKFPDSRQLLLTQAIAYGLVHQFEASKKVLAQIQARWPEWSEAYLIHGIILVGEAKASQAKPLLETAIALGSKDPLAYYNLALAYMESYPADADAAEESIEVALKLNPSDAYTQSLAGKIAYTRKQYQEALRRLHAAIRIWPDMLEARTSLSATYRALGEKQKSIAELKDIQRIQQHLPGSPNEIPPSDLKQVLFSVPAPAPYGG